MFQTFSFLPGIGLETQQRLVSSGYNWNTFLNACAIEGISTPRKHFFDKLITKAKKALHDEDMAFFVDHFSSRDMHKLYSHFKDETIFLDIEVEHVTKDITVIGLYDGVDTKIMIKGKNLDISYLSKFLSHYKLIVTYNGSVFDIPFLKKRYPDLIPKVPVIDLRHMCSRAGYSGGLKQIEKELGICRTNPLVENLVGGDPYKLYRMWKGSGDEHYLRLLVEYNEEDLINLRPILHHLLKSVSR